MSVSHPNGPIPYLTAFILGALVGTLGGLIGLGGAEFRLPLLIGVFGFGALEAVILNKAMSLVVVTFAIPFRAGTVPLSDIAAHWPVVANLLAGSLFGAWVGAGWATQRTRWAAASTWPIKVRPTSACGTDLPFGSRQLRARSSQRV
jgi:uncharacterized membrane protein YfcA